MKMKNGQNTYRACIYARGLNPYTVCAYARRHEKVLRGREFTLFTLSIID